MGAVVPGVNAETTTVAPPPPPAPPPPGAGVPPARFSVCLCRHRGRSRVDRLGGGRRRGGLLFELRLQRLDLLDSCIEPRVGELARFDELERALAELAVGLAQLALRLHLFDAFLRLRGRLLGGLLCLVE